MSIETLNLGSKIVIGLTDTGTVTTTLSLNSKLLQLIEKDSDITKNSILNLDSKIIELR